MLLSIKHIEELRTKQYISIVDFYNTAQIFNLLELPNQLRYDFVIELLNLSFDKDLNERIALELVMEFCEMRLIAPRHYIELLIEFIIPEIQDRN